MGTEYTQLNLEERESLYLYEKEKKPVSWISVEMKRSRSTIYRELRRNTEDSNIGYLPDKANEMAVGRKSNQELKVDKYPKLKKHIIAKLKLGWSPEAISGQAKKDANISFQVSPETIYQFVYSNEGQKIGLFLLLMRKRPRRGKIYGRKPRTSIIPDRISIHERPKDVENRQEFGNFEGDLTFSKGDKSTNLGVVIERKTRFAFIMKNETKHANTAMRNIFNKLAPLPKEALKSITFDNGGEFAKHKLLKKFMNMDTYFCDPGSPWQKGQVERTNSMLHRYISKKTPLKSLSTEQIENAQNMLNHLPRKCLGWKTPAQAFREELVALQN